MIMAYMITAFVMKELIMEILNSVAYTLKSDSYLPLLLFASLKAL